MMKWMGCIAVIIFGGLVSCGSESASSPETIEGIGWAGLSYEGITVDGIQLKTTGICIANENGEYFLVSDGELPRFRGHTIYRVHGRTISKVPPNPHVVAPRYYYSVDKMEKVKSYTMDDLNLVDALEEGDLETADSLIKIGADPEVRTIRYETPLHLVFSKYFKDLSLKGMSEPLETAQLLIDKGANVNARTINGTPPICNAMWAECFKTAELYAQNGADMNMQNAEGDTPLHAYVGRTRPKPEKVLRMLVKYGADMEIKNNKGKTPLDKATVKQREILLKIKSEQDI